MKRLSTPRFGVTISEPQVAKINNPDVANHHPRETAITQKTEKAKINRTSAR